MELRLNKKIYSKAGISDTVKAFDHLCETSMVLDGNHYVVEFSQVDQDVQASILDEFGNYALYATIARKKSW